jgi:8-oxo-dGTP pyrophosphatase MutT (NUDIX family)
MPREKAGKIKNLGVFNIVEHPDMRASILLAKETAKHKAGQRSFPGGSVEKQDIRKGNKVLQKVLESCGLREGVEESGYLLRITHGVAVHARPGDRQHIIVKSEIAGGQLRTSDEHPEVGFHQVDELEAMEAEGQLRWPTMIGDIHRVIEGNMMPIDEFMAKLVLKDAMVSRDGSIPISFQPVFAQPIAVAA